MKDIESEEMQLFLRRFTEDSHFRQQVLAAKRLMDDQNSMQESWQLLQQSGNNHSLGGYSMAQSNLDHQNNYHTRINLTTGETSNPSHTYSLHTDNANSQKSILNSHY